MQILSLAWGILAMLGLFLGVIPCLGWFNWLNIPFAVVGLILSLIAKGQSRPRGGTTATIAIVLNALAILLGYLRLKLGFGIF